MNKSDIWKVVDCSDSLGFNFSSEEGARKFAEYSEYVNVDDCIISKVKENIYEFEDSKVYHEVRLSPELIVVKVSSMYDLEGYIEESSKVVVEHNLIRKLPGNRNWEFEFLGSCVEVVVNNISKEDSIEFARSVAEAKIVDGSWVEGLEEALEANWLKNVTWANPQDVNSTFYEYED